MSNSLYIKLLFWFAVGSWLLLLFINGQVQGFEAALEMAKPAGIVLTILTLAITVFDKWLWRQWGVNPHLVKRPNLIGAYSGTIESHWINPETNQRLPPIPVFLSINETYTCLTARAYTAESSSISLVGSFIKSEDDGQELFYTYRNEPGLAVRHRSAIHYGAAKLKVTDSAQRLDGPYWTDRKTIGDLRFRRFSRETCASFEECQALEAKEATKAGQK